VSVRVEFKLDMPGRGSWDGRWSGEGRNYVIVRTMGAKAAAALLEGKPTKSWGYRWDDGWFASITARVLPKGGRLGKSAGFCGYDWMVSNILDHGSPRSRDELVSSATGGTP
jgi:hypothetical protein